MTCDFFTLTTALAFFVWGGVVGDKHPLTPLCIFKTEGNTLSLSYYIVLKAETVKVIQLLSTLHWKNKSAKLLFNNLTYKLREQER